MPRRALPEPHSSSRYQRTLKYGGNTDKLLSSLRNAREQQKSRETNARQLAANLQARTRGIPGVLDAEAPIDEDVAMAASHVAFSKQGLLDFTGMDDRDGALAVAAARLRGWVAVTDGALGTFIATARGIRHVPAPEVTVVDTLGAGDVWHGAFAVALAEGMDEVRAVAFANATAALKCTRLGGRDGAPLRSEVDEMMKGWEP